MPDLVLIDERLRGYAERWRESVPEPAPIDPDALTGRWGGGGRWLAPVAAVAAAAVLIGAVLTTPGVQAVIAGRVNADVPWAPLAATDPQIPTHRERISFEPLPGIPLCQADQVGAKASLAASFGDTIWVDVDLSTSQPCQLRGRPKVLALDAQGHDLGVAQADSTPDPSYEAPLLITEWRSGQLRLNVQDWCAARPAARYRISWPGSNGSISFNAPNTAPCTPAGAVPTRLVALPFSPVGGWTEPRSDFADLAVVLPETLSGPANAPAQFVVALTSPRDVVLDTCPDFTMTQFFDGRTRMVEERYGLNCQGVPDRNAEGQPMLRAGVPVTFAMEARLLHRSPDDFVWSLQVPELVQGHIRITVG